MRGLFRRLLVLTVVFSLTLGLLLPLAGCGKKEATPGETLDNAIQETGDAVEDVGEAVEEAGEDVEEAME